MRPEAVWWRCHRRNIVDYLLAAGEELFHILGPGHLEAATLTPDAVVQHDGTVVYPTETSHGRRTVRLMSASGAEVPVWPVN